MRDIIVDTDILSDLLIQYYSTFKENNCFSESDKISKILAIKINEIVKRYTEDTCMYHVIASSFAFVEIARKFTVIFNGNLDLYKFRHFINEPPEWFRIASLDMAITEKLSQIPGYVITANGKNESIEWADAIHIATAISRDKWYFATNDHKIKSLTIYQSNLL